MAIATIPVMIIIGQSKGREGAKKSIINPSQEMGVPGIIGSILPIIPTSINRKPIITKSRSIINA
jgi:hypothetical protein